MVLWLAKNNISHDPTMLKAQLYQLVKRNKPAVKYVVDEMAKEHGFEVLRSPIAHCELNPIELIWAQVKGRVARRNKTFRLQDEKRLVESLAGVTPKNWRDAVTHVEKVEKDYWVADRLQEEVVEQIVINIGPGSQ